MRWRRWIAHVVGEVCWECRGFGDVFLMNFHRMVFCFCFGVVFIGLGGKGAWFDSRVRVWISLLQTLKSEVTDSVFANAIEEFVYT